MKATSWLMTGGVVAVVGVGLVQSTQDGASGLSPSMFGQLRPIGQSTTIELERLSIDGAHDPSSSTVGNGGRLAVVSGYSVRSASSVPAIEAHLESRKGSEAWVDTGIVASVTRDGPLVATTPVYSTPMQAESVAYRLTTADSQSNAVTVRYENQRFYTGVAATVYKHASAYCPATAVQIASLQAGRAGDFQSGSLLIRVSDGVGRSTNMDDLSQRSLALHECAHERQWLNWGASSQSRDTMVARSRAVFADGLERGDAVEHAADCAAQAFNPSGYLGYGGYCTPAQVESGRNLLLGQRY